MLFHVLLSFPALPFSELEQLEQLFSRLAITVIEKVCDHFGNLAEYRCTKTGERFVEKCTAWLYLPSFVFSVILWGFDPRGIERNDTMRLFKVLVVETRCQQRPTF